MDHDDSAERIRRRMAELRSDLSSDVREVGRSARAMANLGLYVRRFPWASVTVAAALGYLLVPTKKQAVTPDPAMLAKFIKQNQLRVEANTNETSPKSVLKSLAVMGVMGAAKMGMNYMAQRLASPVSSGNGVREPASASQ